MSSFKTHFLSGITTLLNAITASRLTRLILALGCILNLATCSKNDFPNYNQLGTLRVLALIVDQPEVSPGAAVNITPILSDMNGAGRTLTYTVQACVDPGVGIGAIPACPTPDASNSQSGSVTVPAGTSQTYTDAVASFSITTPASNVIFASASNADQYNGVAYLVFYTITSGTGETVTSFVRVIVSSSSKTPKNQNPVISSINANDSPVTSPLAMPTVATNFSVISPASAAETYQTMAPSGALTSNTEQLVNTWFISDGSFDFQRTLSNSENSWSPPSTKPTSRGLVIMVITRDSHDGTAYQKLELN